MPMLRPSAAEHSCSSVSVKTDPTGLPATFPELASSRITGSMIDRDLFQTIEVTVADPKQPTMAATALVAGASRINIPSGDLTMSSSKAMNPPLFVVDGSSGPIGLATGDVLGPSAVAVTSDGQSTHCLGRAPDAQQRGLEGPAFPRENLPLTGRASVANLDKISSILHRFAPASRWASQCSAVGSAARRRRPTQAAHESAEHKEPTVPKMKTNRRPPSASA